MRINHDIIEILKHIANCPYILDEATISNNGITAAPEQVVGTMHLSYVIWDKLQNIVSRLP